MRLSRHERGEPQPEEAAFTDDEVKEMTRLRPAADAAADEALTAALQSALASSATDGRHAGLAIPSRGPGSVSPLRVLTRLRVTVAATFAMAAALAVLVVQPYSFEGGAGAGARALGRSRAGGSPAIERERAQRVGLPLRFHPLDDPAVRFLDCPCVFPERRSHGAPRDIGPKVTHQKLTLAPCAPLPTGLTAGTGLLVLLIGYPGRLHWLGRRPRPRRHREPRVLSRAAGRATTRPDRE